ncbi:MAG: hypothetical protein ABIQ52_16030 [Vicinamibacterales bacterium]
MPKTRGAKGSRGVPGRQGRTGPRGATGTGLRGTTGARGHTGRRGVHGTKGEAGARGEKGAPEPFPQRFEITEVSRHIDGIYNQLALQLKRMAQIQGQLDDFRGQLKQFFRPG